LDGSKQDRHIGASDLRISHRRAGSKAPSTGLPRMPHSASHRLPCLSTLQSLTCFYTFHCTAQSSVVCSLGKGSAMRKAQNYRYLSHYRRCSSQKYMTARQTYSLLPTAQSVSLTAICQAPNSSKYHILASEHWRKACESGICTLAGFSHLFSVYLHLGAQNNAFVPFSSGEIDGRFQSRCSFETRWLALVRAWSFPGSQKQVCCCAGPCHQRSRPEVCIIETAFSLVWSCSPPRCSTSPRSFYFSRPRSLASLSLRIPRSPSTFSIQVRPLCICEPSYCISYASIKHAFQLDSRARAADAASDHPVSESETLCRALVCRCRPAWRGLDAIRCEVRGFSCPAASYN
jgi:hypothetical protein